MATLTIRQTKKRFGLPHRILINGRMLGVMNTPEINIQLPPGQYQVEIQSLFPFINSLKFLTVSEETSNVLEFRDKEKWWDVVFTADMVLWLAKLFLHLQKPWSTIYEIVSDVVFAVWLFHEWRIRNTYFDITVRHG